MADQTKKSVMALVREVTEATPVAPTAGTQYIAIHDGFSVDASFEALENAELTGSIGAAKSIQGFEAPSASVDHYIRHSGVEGQEPNFGLLMEAAFGAKVVASTQYTTAAASTVAIIKAASGTGVNFQRGQGLLIKDGVNGYKMRPVLSVATDDLTIGFQLPSGQAPAASVGLGKAVLYKPGESHPTMSIWDYRANGAAIQMMAGGRVTEMSIQANAGELISGSFSMEGVKFYFNPVEITSADRYLDILDDATTRAISITAKMYKDPTDVASALETALNASGSSNTFTVRYSSSTGKYTITSTGTTLTLKWATGVNTANTIGDKIGFVTASDDTGALTYTSDNAITLTAPQSTSFDSANPLVAKDNEVLIGDESDANPSAFVAESVSVTVSDSKADIKDVNSESGKSGSIITGRSVSVEVSGVLSRYEAEKFKRFRTSQRIAFLYNFGTKSGGNWEAGKCGMVYMPTAVIESFSLGDSDGLVTISMTLKGYVESGAGEVYLNFL